MTGLDKMISQIIEEAEQSAKGMLDEANAKAEETAKAAAEDAGKLKEEMSRKSEADVANYMERVKSSADLQRRTAILKAKQEVIVGILDKAYASLDKMDERSYFDMIRKMLSKYVRNVQGDICFSSKDLARMPEGFGNEIEAIAAKKGGSLTLSKESRDIDNGFILIYGGVEENCTFRALFNTQKDRLQDMIHRELFS